MQNQNEDTLSDKEREELVKAKDSEARVRTFSPRWDKIITIIAILWGLFQVYFSTIGIISAIDLRVIHILFLSTLVFLLYPSFFNKSKSSPAWYDFILILVAYGAFGYLFLYYGEITMRGGWFKAYDNYAATAAVIITFIMAFRIVPSLAALALVFFLYNFFGQYLSGAFGHTGFSWNRVVQHMFWGTQGLLGVGVGVSASYIFLFVLFGSFLKHSGFSSFINDISLSLVGRTAGGPAKVSVIASALMGMINGSAVANVSTTGAITIPLMKQTGYRKEFAGAVEAVASTGGQFAPPIMGAVGFIMAELLGISYTTVMLAVSIPAFLYYLGLMMAVHFEARKLGLKGFSKENIPDAIKVLKERGHLLIPLIVLLTILFMGYTPLFAAAFAIFATILAANIRKNTRMSLETILKAMNEGARGALGVCAACVIIGIIIGTVSLSALGVTFAQEILNYVGEDQLYLGAFLVMLISIVLGMGVPGVAAYVIVAAVAVPVLIKIGATPIAAHLFCLFYACLSNITPPVAISSFVAAGIARADETKTSLIAMRLGLSGFILPFFFLDNPLLLYNTDHGIFETLWAFCSACLGIIALAAALEGWLIKACNIIVRLLLFIIAFMAIHPNLYTDCVGISLFIVAVLLNKNAKKSEVI